MLLAIGKFGLAAAVLLLLIAIPKYFIQRGRRHKLCWPPLPLPPAAVVFAVAAAAADYTFINSNQRLIMSR